MVNGSRVSTVQAQMYHCLWTHCDIRWSTAAMFQQYRHRCTIAYGHIVTLDGEQQSCFNSTCTVYWCCNECRAFVWLFDFKHLRWILTQWLCNCYSKRKSSGFPTIAYGHIRWRTAAMFQQCVQRCTHVAISVKDLYHYRIFDFKQFRWVLRQ